MEEKFYLFSLENGVSVIDLEINQEEGSVLIDGCMFIMTHVNGNIYMFTADDFTEGSETFLGSTDPYELRSYVMSLFMTL